MMTPCNWFDLDHTVNWGFNQNEQMHETLENVRRNATAPEAHEAGVSDKRISSSIRKTENE